MSRRTVPAMCVARLVLVLMAALAGCASLPPDRPFAAGDVTVDLLDRDPQTGRLRFAIENHTREPLRYAWPHVAWSASPVPGSRGNLWDLAGAGTSATQERPLAPGRRQILDIVCDDGDGCSDPRAHAGVLVCRRQQDDCTDFETVWSANTIGDARVAGRP